MGFLTTCNSFENRARTMSNEMAKIDLLVSSALELRPDIDSYSKSRKLYRRWKIRC